MKPGPARGCECGQCYLCKHRSSKLAYYRRNAKLLAQKNAERKRQREAGIKAAERQRQRQREREPTDEELDQKAAAWLERIPRPSL